MSDQTTRAPSAADRGTLGFVSCSVASDDPNIITVDAEANRFVTEMQALGATFTVTRTGADVQWVYVPPVGMREPLRRLKASFDLTRPGMRDAVVRAILRTKYVGAP